MDEGYVQPGHFLFGTVTSVLIGMLMNAASRREQTEGRQAMSDPIITDQAPVELIGYSIEDLKAALDLMENSLEVGEKTRIQICTDSLATDEELAQLYIDLTSLGEHTSYPVAYVEEGIPVLQFDLRKGSPALPVAVIPLIGLLSILGLIAFGVFKIGEISAAILPILLVLIGGAVIIAAIAKKPAERIAERLGTKYLPSTYPKALAAR
jgi:hypothetical protein